MEPKVKEIALNAALQICSWAGNNTTEALLASADAIATWLLTPPAEPTPEQ